MKKVDENKAMVVSQTKEVKHHADELSKVLGKHKNIESWVVGKIERASTDLSDVTHYLDGKQYAKGGNILNLKKPLTHEQFVKLAKDKGYKNLDEAYKDLGYRWDSENWIDDRIKPFSKRPKHANGGDVESKEWQIKNNDKYFSIGMDGNFKWYESPDLGYTYTYDEVQELSNIIKKQYPNIEIVKYNKDWWKTNKYAKGGGVETKGKSEIDQFKTGGVVKFYNKDNEHRLARPSGSIEKEILNKVRYDSIKQDFVGSFGWKTIYNKLGDGYLYKLDEYDQDLMKNIPLKSAERIYRYINRTTAIGGISPLIKMNIEKGLLYFPVYNEADDIIFETRGVKALWISLIEDKYAKGGEVESEINELYKKSKFINDDFNWKLKLLEMLQDNSIDAYNIYQTLTKEQKEQVLQEQYEVDNDMGSDGDGDIETSKENLQILLEDAKNGKKYAKGGDIGGFCYSIGGL
jgi:hypothetical protein